MALSNVCFVYLFLCIPNSEMYKAILILYWSGPEVEQYPESWGQKDKPYWQ